MEEWRTVEVAACVGQCPRARLRDRAQVNCTFKLGHEGPCSFNMDNTYKEVSGITRSHNTPNYNMNPIEAEMCLADRMTIGLTQHTPNSWQEKKEQTLHDDAMYIHALNHAKEHLGKLSACNFSDDTAWGHLGAIMWACAIWAWRIKRLNPTEEEIKKMLSPLWLIPYRQEKHPFTKGVNEMICEVCGCDPQSLFHLQ